MLRWINRVGGATICVWLVPRQDKLHCHRKVQKIIKPVKRQNSTGLKLPFRASFQEIISSSQNIKRESHFQLCKFQKNNTSHLHNV